MVQFSSIKDSHLPNNAYYAYWHFRYLQSWLHQKKARDSKIRHLCPFLYESNYRNWRVLGNHCRKNPDVITYDTDGTCVDVYRSKSFRPGVFLHVKNLLVTILKAKHHGSPPRCKAFPMQGRKLVVPPLDRVPGTPVPAAKHWVVICCDHFPSRRLHSVLQRPSRLCPTKLIYEPGSLKMFPKLVFAESPCVLGTAPPFATPSHIHWVTPFLDAKLNALVVTQGSTRASPHSGDLLLKSPATRDRPLASLKLSSRGRIWVMMISKGSLGLQ